MTTSRGQAVVAARKLLRTLASAPEPRRHARAIYAELTRAHGWSPQEQAQIEAFGAWSLDRPSIEALKPQFEKLLAAIG